MTTYIQTYAICPWCKEQSGRRVDHLFKGKPTSAGPWACKECGRWFSVNVTAAHDVTLTPTERFAMREYEPIGRYMVLLKVETASKPLYFVMDNSHHKAGEDIDAVNSHFRYFYEEHSCPTNWLPECVMVWEDGDPDPHGSWTHVRSVEVPRDFDDGDDDAVIALFPELSTESPSRIQETS